MKGKIQVTIKPCDTPLTVDVEYSYLLNDDSKGFTRDNVLSFCIFSVTHNGLEILDYLHYNTIAEIEESVFPKE